ncbi:alpha/beta fold hydrolase [Streptomyces sp. DH12]|uniref:alpha/beta fold hydrolase n=1 Tax=Streptomyces sp. DH12 TaxID=2857010 RepID=UPI001E4DC11D|nr:alpha/beta fold hydrolase [Streptomyces sp. DH12]
MATEVSFTVDTPRGPRALSVCYERRGEGEPLLLLHGIGHHWQAWEPVLDVLAGERDVIAADLPGFGGSEALPDGVAYDPVAVVPALGALCAALGVERPHVAGNSLGGLLALGMGRAGLARSVTALSPAGFWSEAERRYAYAALRAMRLGARALPVPLIERLSRSAAGRVALTSAIYARPARRSPEAVVAEALALRAAVGFERTLAAGRGVPYREDVPGVPVTIGWGTRDRLLSPRQGLRARGVLPRARLVRLPGCGHVPMHDDPALVARVLLDGSGGLTARPTGRGADRRSGGAAAGEGPSQR